MSLTVEMEELLLPTEGCPQALPALWVHWKCSVAFAFISLSVQKKKCPVSSSRFHLALKINMEKVPGVIIESSLFWSL